MTGGVMSGINQGKSQGQSLSLSYVPFDNPMSISQRNLLYVTYTYKKIMTMTHGDGNYYFRKVKGAPGTHWKDRLNGNIMCDADKSILCPKSHSEPRGDFIIFSKMIRQFNEAVEGIKWKKSK